MEFKILFSTIAIILVILGYAPYIRDTLLNKTRPHTFTYFIWSLTTFIIFFLQMKGGAGVGAWVTLVIACAVFLIFVLSFKNGKKDIRKIDILFLCLSLGAIPLWLIAKKPMISNIILSLINLIGFIPAMRKSWIDPYSETFSLYGVNTIRYVFAIIALVNINVLTVLSPASALFGNLSFFVLLVGRRWFLRGK